MSWFRGNRSSAVATATTDSAADPAAPPPPELHGSLALATLLAELKPGRPLRILDLGPAVGANIQRWSERTPCSVEVADLYRSLADLGSGADPYAAARSTLPDRPGEPVDLVLAWDVLNYLDKPQIRAVAERLAARCRPGATLFAMLLTGALIPREPGSYLIRDQSRLVYRVDPRRTRPGPRYRPAEIDALTPGFSVDRNFLLRHGVQEYLLLRDPPTEADAAARGDTLPPASGF